MQDPTAAPKSTTQRLHFMDTVTAMLLGRSHNAQNKVCTDFAVDEMHAHFNNESWQGRQTELQAMLQCCSAGCAYSLQVLTSQCAADMKVEV